MIDLFTLYQANLCILYIKKIEVKKNIYFILSFIMLFKISRNVKCEIRDILTSRQITIKLYSLRKNRTSAFEIAFKNNKI